MSEAVATQTRFKTRPAFHWLFLVGPVMIAMLGAIVVPKFAGHNGVQTSAAKADLSVIRVALDNFKADNKRYPTTEEGLTALVRSPGNLPNWQGYLTITPRDPWARSFIYRCPGKGGRDYDLICTGPSGQEGNSDNLTE